MPPSRLAGLVHSLLMWRLLLAALDLLGHRWPWEREKQHRFRLFEGVRRPPWLGATASRKRKIKFEIDFLCV